MNYRSIVVHLDTGEGSHPRFEFALQLAKESGAHLTGVFAVSASGPASFYVLDGSAEYDHAHYQVRRERRAALEQLFRAGLENADVAGDWIATEGYAGPAVLRHARCADLIVAGQDDPDDPESHVAGHFQANLIMSSGRPVLLHPYAGTFSPVSAQVMVAWDGSREATRAINDALPLLRRAKKTTVVTVRAPETTLADHPIAEQDIAAMIARHGVQVDMAECVLADSMSIGDALLSLACDLNAGLIVMGAYGHARWQELILGGA